MGGARRNRLVSRSAAPTATPSSSLPARRCSSRGGGAQPWRGRGHDTGSRRRGVGVQGSRAGRWPPSRQQREHQWEEEDEPAAATLARRFRSIPAASSGRELVSADVAVAEADAPCSKPRAAQPAATRRSVVGRSAWSTTGAAQPDVCTTAVPHGVAGMSGWWSSASQQPKNMSSSASSSKETQRFGIQKKFEHCEL